VRDPALLFDDYLEKHRERKKQAGKDFINKIEDQAVSKLANQNSALGHPEPNRKLVLIQDCKKHKEIALPIISKIRHKELNLASYKLSHTHCASLAEVFNLEPDTLTKINL